MPDTPSSDVSPVPASTPTTPAPLHPASGSVPISPMKVEIETKVVPNSGKEAERLLADLLGRLDRNQATPAEQAMVERQIQVIQLTCAELRAACKARPNHELAAHFLAAIKSMPDTQQIHIEQPDLQALVQDRKMVIRHQLVGDTIVMSKDVQ